MFRRGIPTAITLLFLLIASVITACGGTGGQSPSDSHSSFNGGKGDLPNGWTQCTANEALLLLNDRTTSSDKLTELGVHKRGAENLIEYRNGNDGEMLTEDDNYFSSLHEIDDVYYVGPAAMKSLKKTVDTRCDPDSKPGADVIFSPKPFENSHIFRAVDAIDNTEQSLDIAMYSFDAEPVFKALKRAVERGVSIRMIYHKADENAGSSQHTMSDRLEQLGIDVRYVNKIMHHKFFISDGPRQTLTEANNALVYTSSGNWSYGAATRYDENTVLARRDTELTLRLQREFNKMWNNSRDFETDAEFDSIDAHPVRAGMIPDRAGVDGKFTSENFDTYDSSRYGPTFSANTDERNVADKLIELIQNARESIWLASGHLRYRPVADALIEKHKDNPDMDIRVYLDGQEYTSKGYYEHLESELRDCLDEAEDANERRDCKNSGFYFGYPLHKAGLDVRFKYYSYYWHYSYARQMHHKYMIIDGQTVASGSYNISENAEHGTMENLIIYHANRYPDLVSQFEDNFRSIWKTRRGDGTYENLMSRIENADDEVPIRFEPMALTWPQISDLKSAIGDACPAIYSDEYRDNKEEHKVCEL